MTRFKFWGAPSISQEWLKAGALKVCTKGDHITSCQRDDKSPIKGAWFCSRDTFLYAQLWYVRFRTMLFYGRGTARRACQYKFCNYKTSNLNTRVPGLSCGIICMILRFFVQYRSVTDRHTQGDRQTDRLTTTACTALSIASRGKNRPYCTAHQV